MLSRSPSPKQHAHQAGERGHRGVDALEDVVVDEDGPQRAALERELGAQREHRGRLALLLGHHAHAGDAHASCGQELRDLGGVRVARNDVPKSDQETRGGGGAPGGAGGGCGGGDAV